MACGTANGPPISKISHNGSPAAAAAGTCFSQPSPKVFASHVIFTPYFSWNYCQRSLRSLAREPVMPSTHRFSVVVSQKNIV